MASRDGSNAGTDLLGGLDAHGRWALGLAGAHALALGVGMFVAARATFGPYVGYDLPSNGRLSYVLYTLQPAIVPLVVMGLVPCALLAAAALGNRRLACAAAGLYAPCALAALGVGISVASLFAVAAAIPCAALAVLSWWAGTDSPMPGEATGAKTPQGAQDAASGEEAAAR